MDTNIKNEWMGERFLPSIYTYWKSRIKPDELWVFISEKQYTVCQKYLTKITEYIESYSWFDKTFLVKTIRSQKGTFYMVSFESKIVENLESLSHYFLSKITASNAESYFNIFMAILEDTESDLDSEKSTDPIYRKTVSDLYNVCVDTMTEIKEKFGI